MKKNRKIMKMINKKNTTTIGEAVGEILGLNKETFEDIYIMPVLDKEEKFNSMIYKLFEEIEEVDSAYWDFMYGTEENETINMNSIVSETLDVMQIAIGILEKASRFKGVNLDKSFRTHMDKLISRGWKIKSAVYIRERKL